jgi:hypothetical protein
MQLDSNVQVIEKDASLEIIFPKRCIIPLGLLLGEVLAFNSIMLLTSYIFRFISTPLFAGHFVTTVIVLLISPFIFVWNCTANDSIKVNRNSLKLSRRQSPIHLRSNNYELDDVFNLRVLDPNEWSLFAKIPVLRLIFIINGGLLGFETKSGMIVRFGWNINSQEGEDIIAKIRQLLVSYQN